MKAKARGKLPSKSRDFLKASKLLSASGMMISGFSFQKSGPI